MINKNYFFLLKITGLTLRLGVSTVVRKWKQVQYMYGVNYFIQQCNTMQYNNFI